jgi:hypothetical protein
MMAFLITIAFVVTLIVFGVYISAYLYNQGAIGSHSINRSRRFQGFAVESSADTLTAEDRYMSGNSGVYATTHYARWGFLVLSGFSVVIVMIVVSVIGALIH